MPVSETAFAVGYGSLSYFNRLFNKEFGCSPSQYRGEGHKNNMDNLNNLHK
ncbi:helix-turn-helix domain-containing protein [Paraglaciecola hydrolytica]|uniref:helix-turn-helix domain-containing protein n=1 Tax=Paraglaciecola hydrolytica TaxID=1799789 RepID=UPI003899149F